MHLINSHLDIRASHQCRCCSRFCFEGHAAALPSQCLTPSRVLASTADVAKASKPPLCWDCRRSMSSTWARAEALSSRSSRSCLLRSSAHALSYRPDGEVWLLRKHTALAGELTLCLTEQGLSCRPGSMPWLQHAHSITLSFSVTSGRWQGGLSCTLVCCCKQACICSYECKAHRQLACMSGCCSTCRSSMTASASLS